MGTLSRAGTVGAGAAAILVLAACSQQPTPTASASPSTAPARSAPAAPSTLSTDNAVQLNSPNGIFSITIRCDSPPEPKTTQVGAMTMVAWVCVSPEGVYNVSETTVDLSKTSVDDRAMRRAVIDAVAKGTSGAMSDFQEATIQGFRASTASIAASDGSTTRMLVAYLKGHQIAVAISPPATYDAAVATLQLNPPK